MRKGLLITVGAAMVLTAVIAWPVLVAPSHMIFGDEIAGRHHDAYTVIFQIATGFTAGPYAQPLTDRVGWLMARVFDPVVAYNLLVLITFPFSAATTYALGRYLAISHGGAMVAALVFAFAPFHLAHAAYHPHIAQTQWLPLFFLALFALIDRPGWRRAAGLALALAALVLSNDYAALIGAVITPVALVAYWATSDGARGGWRNLAVPGAVLAVLAGAALGVILVAAPEVLAAPAQFAFPISDVGTYSARWWAFFVPPVNHAVLGAAATRIAAAKHVGDAVVEEQIYLGYAVMALAAVAAFIALRAPRAKRQRRWVLAALAIALVAALVSLGPFSGTCDGGSWAPACRLHQIAPMFRSYARFAVVTLLMLSLAAGAGFAWLRSRSRGSSIVAFGLVAVAAFEFWPLPPRAHDVLPTQAHRWLAGQSPEVRALDCVSMTPPIAMVPWMIKRDLEFLGPQVRTCRDPELAAHLAALHVTHVIVERSDPNAAFVDALPGLTKVQEFPDSRVYFVSATVPAILTLRADGFYESETANGAWWRWMPATGQWVVRNTTQATLRASLTTLLESVVGSRELALILDGVPVGTVGLTETSREYTMGPWSISPGDHTLTFQASGPLVRPSDRGNSPDTRQLAVCFRNSRWTVQ